MIEPRDEWVDEQVRAAFRGVVLRPERLRRLVEQGEVADRGGGGAPGRLDG